MIAPATDSRQTLRTSRNAGVPGDLLVPGKSLGEWKRWLSGNVAAGLRMFGPRGSGVFGILMYHRVADLVPGVEPPTWNVTPARLHAQLAGLLERGYVAWPLRRVLEHCRRGDPVPRKVFVVTFDDGYANNFTRAWPVLRELQVPATIFLATAYVDTSQPFPSDDWAAAGSKRVPAEAWRPMTWAQCRELRDSGLVELGAHTHTHADFRGRPDDLRTDLRECLAVLKRELRVEQPTFAFPYGTPELGFAGGALTEAVRETGVLCSLTTEDRLAGVGEDPFAWGRFTAEQHDTATTLAAKLDGWYAFLRDGWRRLRRRSVENEGPARVGRGSEPVTTEAA